MSDKQTIANPLDFDHLPDLIKFSRIQKGISQKDLCAATEIGPRRAHALECDPEACAKMPFGDIEKILSAIGVKIVLVRETSREEGAQ